MSWRAIARKDLRDSARSRTLWLLLGGFLLLMVLPVVAFPSVVAPDPTGFVEFTQVVVSGFVPLVSIALGYKAVIGERESGSVKLLLSFPHSRRDLAVGKFVGRAVVLAAPLALALAAAGVAAYAVLGSLPAMRYTGVVLASLGFGLAFLGLTLGLSMALETSRRVTGAAIGAYVLFAMVWETLVQVLVFALFRFMDPRVVFDLPDWALFVKFLAPVEAYDRLVQALFDLGVAGGYTSGPWFVAAWVAPLVLLAWVVVPVAVGYRRFARSDM